jgi:hypothetical protein
VSCEVCKRETSTKICRECLRLIREMTKNKAWIARS